MNYLAVLVAAMMAFVASTGWYIVFAKQRATLSAAAATTATGMPPAWKVLVELVRSAIVATVLAGLSARLGIVEWTGAVLLAVALWLGFPAMILAGSVQWENVPWRLAAIHAGDWLLKLVLIAVIVGVWR